MNCVSCKINAIYFRFKHTGCSGQPSRRQNDINRALWRSSNVINDLWHEGNVDSWQTRAATLPCLTLVSSRGWLPVFGADDWQADLALLVDVRMVDFRFEGDPRGLEGVLSREDELHPKRSLVVRRAILGCGGGKYHGCTLRPKNVAAVLPSMLYLTLCQTNGSSLCADRVLTGTMYPCQVSMFDSSTWMPRKFLMGACWMSWSSCAHKKTRSCDQQHTGDVGTIADVCWTKIEIFSFFFI